MVGDKPIKIDIMEKQALLKRGFVDTSYDYEGDHFSEFTLQLQDLTIMISGIDLVEIGTPNDWLTVPNCKTIKDLDDLIRLFN